MCQGSLQTRMMCSLGYQLYIYVSSMLVRVIHELHSEKHLTEMMQVCLRSNQMCMNGRKAINNMYYLRSFIPATWLDGTLLSFFPSATLCWVAKTYLEWIGYI